MKKILIGYLLMIKIKLNYFSRYFLSVCLLGLCGKAFSENVPIKMTKIVNLKDKTFRAIEIKPRHVRLHWKNTNGKAYRYLSNVKAFLDQEQRSVIALMNSGIYSKNNNPAGLHIENGQMLQSLNIKTGKGNFHLQPNGVFLITNENKAKIISTKKFERNYTNKADKIRIATQSGPMLVIDGKINKKFIANSHYAYTRSGVCTTPKGILYFISTDTFPRITSNLYQFAKATQKLGCSNALYLDGNISKLYINGEDSTFHFSSFVGILSASEPYKIKLK